MRRNNFLYGLLLFPFSLWGQREGKVFYIWVDRLADSVEYEQRQSVWDKEISHHWNFTQQADDHWRISFFRYPVKPPFISPEIVRKPLSFVEHVVCHDRSWMQEQAELNRLFPGEPRADYVEAFKIHMQKHWYEKDGSIDVNNWLGKPELRNNNRVFLLDKAFIDGDSITLYEVRAEIHPILKHAPTYLLLDRNSPHINYCSNDADTNTMSSAYRCWDFYNTDVSSKDSVFCYLYQPDPQRLGVQGDWLIERKPLSFLDSITYYDEKWLRHGWNVFTKIPVRWDDKRPRAYILDRATIQNDSIVMYEVVLHGLNNGDDFYEGYDGFGFYFCE